MAERLAAWPSPPVAPWEHGALSEGPARPEGDVACPSCDGFKTPAAVTCRRCMRALRLQQRDRCRVLLHTHTPQEVAAIMGVHIDTVYRAR